MRQNRGMVVDEEKKIHEIVKKVIMELVNGHHAVDHAPLRDTGKYFNSIFSF